MPSRKGWVTGLPEELWVCAAAEVTRRRPAAPPERARYMASQASSRRTAPQAWHVCSGAACQARGGPWQARVGVDGAGRTVYSKNLNMPPNITRKASFSMIVVPRCPRPPTDARARSAVRGHIHISRHLPYSVTHRTLLN